MTNKRIKYFRSTKDWMRHVKEFHGNKFDGIDETTWHCGEDELEEFVETLRMKGSPFKIWFKVEYMERRN